MRKLPNPLKINQLKKVSRFFKVKMLLYVFRAFEKFSVDKCTYHAAALTFFTLFALVPFLGLMFGIAQSFGFEKLLMKALENVFQGQEETYQYLYKFSQNLLDQTREELIAGIGFLILLWSVFKVFRALDYIFNKVWVVTFQKSPFYRIHQFIALLLLLPIALVILGGVALSVISNLSSYFPTLMEINLNLWVSSTTLLSIILFTLIVGFSYKGLPIVEVTLQPALLAGFIASLGFHLLQYGYIVFQKQINSLGVVYGSFASIPLFMLWIYISWSIFLYGAELTYVIESKITRRWTLNHDRLPLHAKNAICLEMMEIIKEQFAQGKLPLNTKQLSNRLSLPLATTRLMLDRLIAAELVTQAHIPQSRLICYIPSKPLNTLTQQYILDHLESATLGAKPKYGKVIENIINKYNGNKLHY